MYVPFVVYKATHFSVSSEDQADAQRDGSVLMVTVASSISAEMGPILDIVR